MFIFYLVMIQSYIYCSLWVSTPPTLAQWQEYCPAFPFEIKVTAANITGLADPDTWLFVRAVDIITGEVICEKPAFHGLSGLPCGGIQHTDDVFLQLIWKDTPWILCTARTDSPSPPDTACTSEIPDGAILEWRGPWQVEPMPTQEAVITPPTPAFPDPADLATANNYDSLDYWIRWYGLEDPIAWQNQWDEGMLGAGHQTNVPPEILKGVIGQESQYWPGWTGDAGEVGLIQLTWDGADTALRYSPALYARYCERGIWWGYCSRPYDTLATWMKGRIAAALVADLTLSGMPWERAAQVNDDLVTYARILAAYYSYAAALGYEGWDYALAVFNAGGTCINSGVICPEGLVYIQKVRK